MERESKSESQALDDVCCRSLKMANFVMIIIASRNNYNDDEWQRLFSRALENAFFNDKKNFFYMNDKKSGI